MAIWHNSASTEQPPFLHTVTMNDEERLEQFIELCKRVYERLERDGSWPWPEEPDSTVSDDLVESKDNPQNV